jgi:hypothetical protein
LSGADAAGKGADSLHDADAAALAATRLAKEYQCITAVTGAVDLVRALYPHRGSPRPMTAVSLIAQRLTFNSKTSASTQR